MIFEVKELATINVKGQEKKKRDVIVADDTNQGISLVRSLFRLYGRRKPSEPCVQDNSSPSKACLSMNIEVF
jgi:hypothetical protein